MAEEKKKGITVKKEDDMAEWYAQLCLKSELADYAPVKGCYILRPLGYALWERIQEYFNKRMKYRGVQNAYFPLFIPESFFKKEATHAEGFTPEVAWIANRDEEGSERLAIRPTSETIMYDSYARWLRSWRDLPIRINQWANVVRWETKATKLFLRSREFLWQEGHCVYENRQDCDREVELFLIEYKDLCEHLLAVPVIYGRKTDKEKFAGADYTMTIEAFMPDGKAIQCGTSHNLGQGFAKAFGLSFQDKNGEASIPWQSSWGISTRLIGTTVMQHSDNKGLVLPPNLAPNKVVIIPILFDKTRDMTLGKCDELKNALHEFDPILDDREEYSPGWKFNEWELKGVPVRLELGPKDLEAGQVTAVVRDTGEKQYIKINDLRSAIPELLALMQKRMFEKARQHLESSIVEVRNMDELKKAVEEKRLAKTYFCGEPECEDWIKDKTAGATSRCIPFKDEKAPKGSRCVHCAKEAKWNIYFSKSY
ncbi:proline--tRNA ligase [Candidatus Woesearchaeota archaeon]|nr:proline--tRNA ligase [Candidatus Woesearchaeota archaeon]